MRSVLIVAHPDDECLWFGGPISANPADDWTIIVCTIPRTDPIRAWKFFAACEVFGARARLLPWTEPAPNQALPTGLLDLLDLSEADRIVTHGVEGEYGHAHHKALHAYIHRKWATKDIWSACPPGKSGYAVEVVLTEEQLTRKLAALMRYDHVLPYEGVAMPKGAALIKRYCKDGGWNFGVERYRISHAH